MKLTPAQIKKYNKIADAGKKPIMVRVGSKWYTWYEGDPKYGVFLTTQSGKDVEFDFKQIDDIQEGVEKLTKSKLREIIREEIKKLHEGGMGILGKDQADILQAIVMRNKNKNSKAIFNLVMKTGHFKGVDKKEMLGYIEGAKMFAKYMKI
jgi:hypothetical protein